MVTSLAVPGPTRSLRGGGRELLGERVVDAGLDVDAVGADAGLAGVPELAGDRTLDRLVEVGVVEDDERRVAAQLHRGPLDRVGALLEQDLADLGRAGEGDLAHGLVGAQLGADRAGAAGDHVEHARRDARPLGELGHGQGRVRAWPLAGLTTMVQPAASAGPTLRVIMALGKFQGVIAAHTPTGCLITRIRREATVCGMTSP